MDRDVPERTPRGPVLYHDVADLFDKLRYRIDIIEALPRNADHEIQLEIKGLQFHYRIDAGDYLIVGDLLAEKCP